MVGNIKGFVGEVQAEMKKVSWPSKEQLKESTIVVLVVTVIITLLVGVMDFGLKTIVGLLADLI
jgi:preprotein translocase subunit SecE